MDFFPFSLLYRFQRQPSRGQTLLLVYRFLILCLPVICCSGTGTLYPEMSVKPFISCVGESCVRLQADDEKQEHGRYVPSPHSPGLLSSFPSVSAVLWCTDAPHSPPATAWCVWSVWSGKEKEQWGHTNGLMKAAVLQPPYCTTTSVNILFWLIFFRI